jgi:Ring finger domain
MFLETGTLPSRQNHRSHSRTESSGEAYQHSQGGGGGLSTRTVATEAESMEHRTTESATVTVEEHEDGTTCCSPAEPHAQSIHDFFRRLMRDRWRPSDHSYDIMRQGSQEEEEQNNEQHVTDTDTPPATTPPRKKTIPSSSPLRPALSYDSSQSIPCIHADEIVLPGSLLQKEMARQMLALSNPSKESVDQDWENECVICMEGFDPTNPRMPTLCGCGTNKTYFHLPCLYQWLEQSRECPSCRAPITWQEF